jgi:hypothetical protein
MPEDRRDHGKVQHSEKDIIRFRMMTSRLGMVMAKTRRIFGMNRSSESLQPSRADGSLVLLPHRSRALLE